MRRMRTLLTATSLAALYLALVGPSVGAAGGSDTATPTPQAPAPAIAPGGGQIAAPPAPMPIPPAAPLGVPQPPPLPPGMQAPNEVMQKLHQQHIEERSAQHQTLRQQPEGAGPAPGQMPTPPVPPEPLTMPPSLQSAQERDALREQQYQEMRERAKARGVEMPETPPWKAAGVSEEERRAQMEKMRAMTPAERQAHREALWQSMRERAKQRGAEAPEAGLSAGPGSMGGGPWLGQQERERYQAIVNQMTPEQRAAAKALYGALHPPCMMAPPWGGQVQPEGPPPFGGIPGAQGPAALQGMPQGNWFGPGPAQAPAGQGQQLPQGYPTGQGSPWGYAPGSGMPEGQGPAGFSGPQGFWSGFPGTQGYGPGFGGYQEMPPPPPVGRIPGGGMSQ